MFTVCSLTCFCSETEEVGSGEHVTDGECMRHNNVPWQKKLGMWPRKERWTKTTSERIKESVKARKETELRIWDIDRQQRKNKYRQKQKERERNTEAENNGNRAKGLTNSVRLWAKFHGNTTPLRWKCGFSTLQGSYCNCQVSYFLCFIGCHPLTYPENLCWCYR